MQGPLTHALLFKLCYTNRMDQPQSQAPTRGHVESFDLDHTRVRAPYVRLAGTQTTPSGDTISKYDLRLLQPNQDALPKIGRAHV